MRISTRLITASAILASSAGVAYAQVPPNGGQPTPGSGNSGSIANTNREANSSYNHIVGAGDPKPNPEQQADRPHAKHSAAAPATAADIIAGSALRDSQGVAIGKVETVDASGAVVNTGQTKIKVPLSAFGKDDQGLVLGITAAHFNELIAKAHGSN